MTHFAAAWDNPEFTTQQLDTFLGAASKYRFVIAQASSFIFCLLLLPSNQQTFCVCIVKSEYIVIKENLSSKNVTLHLNLYVCL